MTAPLSKKLRCKVSGHDWRRAIGPRDGFFERCRRCYSTRLVEDSAVSSASAGRSTERTA